MRSVRTNATHRTIWVGSVWAVALAILVSAGCSWFQSPASKRAVPAEEHPPERLPPARKVQRSADQDLKPTGVSRKSKEIERSLGVDD